MERHMSSLTMFRWISIGANLSVSSARPAAESPHWPESLPGWTIKWRESYARWQSCRRPGPDRGMVFQGYTLFPWLTVKRNIMFGLSMHGKSDSTAEVEARQWLEMVGLSKFENVYPHELSGGMKQRVAIARALANNPRILLMDEPFAALDALTRCKMQSYLLQIWKKMDVTILFITHDLEEAAYFADRIVVMGVNPGGILEVIENPVPRPRDATQFLSPEFLALKARLDELIHGPADQPRKKNCLW